jgi:hypothetical protein
MPSRRDFLRASTGAVAALVAVRRLGALPTAAPTKITIYKTSTCGCCKVWVQHLEKAGFVATVHDLPGMPQLNATKKTIGVPAAMQTCHTAVVATYWIEGHVPADVITKLLAEKPVIAGLAVPGMPTGSPGMEAPDGRKEPYDILAVDKAGKTRVFAKR